MPKQVSDQMMEVDSLVSSTNRIQCSPPNSNLWGTQTEFDLSDFLNYENSF